MIRIGILGDLGSGKSFVARKLEFSLENLVISICDDGDELKRAKLTEVLL